MAYSEHERSSRNQETLIFNSPEQAEQFAERAAERVGLAEEGEVKRGREVLREEVAEEFLREGEAVSVLSQPWEHTEEEHEEVQRLIDVSFDRSLTDALKQARESDNYPRNVDLLHDILTDQLYEVVVERRLNQQQLSEKPIVAVAVVAAVFFIALFSLLIY